MSVFTNMNFFGIILFMKILILIIGWTLGVFTLKFRLQVMDLLGRFEFAEKYLGPSGNYLVVIFLAGIFFFYPILNFFGVFESIFNAGISPV